MIFYCNTKEGAYRLANAMLKAGFNGVCINEDKYLSGDTFNEIIRYEVKCQFYGVASYMIRSIKAKYEYPVESVDHGF